MTKLKPKSRTCPTCCINEGQIIVFGGLNSEGLDDIWACDLNKGFIWRNLNPLGAKRPLGRYGHSVVSFQNELYFFGGLYSNSIAPEEDLLIYSLSKYFLIIGQNKWEYQRINHINKLGHRRNHIAHLIGPNMIIYGGISLSEDILGDLWLLDLITLEIRSIDEKGSKPSKLVYMASTLVLDSEKAKQSSFSIYKFPETQKKKYRV
jgi:hypothetical protein